MYKNPIGDALEKPSVQAYLLVISGMKLVRRDPKKLSFGCRDIQGRVRYIFCLSSMPRSGVIPNLSQDYISDLLSRHFLTGNDLGMLCTYVSAVLLPGRSARLQNRQLNETHGRDSP